MQALSEVSTEVKNIYLLLCTGWLHPESHEPGRETWKFNSYNESFDEHYSKMSGIPNIYEPVNMGLAWRVLNKMHERVFDLTMHGQEEQACFEFHSRVSKIYDADELWGCPTVEFLPKVLDICVELLLAIDTVGLLDSIIRGHKSIGDQQ